MHGSHMHTDTPLFFFAEALFLSQKKVARLSSMCGAGYAMYVLVLASIPPSVLSCEAVGGARVQVDAISNRARHLI